MYTQLKEKELLVCQWLNPFLIVSQILLLLGWLSPEVRPLVIISAEFNVDENIYNSSILEICHQGQKDKHPW